MKARSLWVVLAIAAVLAMGACNKAEPTPAAEIAMAEGEVAGPRGSLQGVTGLALGIFKLEATEHAVTPEQAKAMLPLWKAIQSGSLQGAVETEAVRKQIGGVLDEDQRAAIEGMELTLQELGTWMQSPAAQTLGIEMPARPEGEADVPEGAPGRGAFQNLTEEQRTQFRQELQNMTDEERATRAAVVGFQRPEGGTPGGGPGEFEAGQGRRPDGFAGRGGGNFLVDPLIELLTERAAE